MSELSSGMTLTTKRGFRYSLPAGKIPLQESSISKSGVYESEIESTIYQFVRPGMTVVECGASCGYHTLNFASAVGRSGYVYGFEANPELVNYLQKNIVFNNFSDRVEVINKGVSRNGKPTFLSLPISGVGVGGAFLHGTSPGWRSSHLAQLFAKILDMTPGLKSLKKSVSLSPFWDSRRNKKRELIPINTISLDYFFDSNKKVDFIKMDIEGSELEAIRGSRNILSSNNAILLIEWLVDQKTREETKQLYYFLTELNYNIYRIKQNSLVQIQSLENFFSEPPPKYGQDFLCVK